jgi:hypothetical protein
MLNAIFGNNLAISWQPVLVVEEAGLPGETTDHGQVTGQIFSLAAASRDQIGGVMVSVLVSSAVDHGLSPDQVKLKSIFCCFSSKHTALRRKSQHRVAVV